MIYANLTHDGAILGAFHTTKEAATAAAKLSAKRLDAPVHVVCYGNAGDVKSITIISA